MTGSLKDGKVHELSVIGHFGPATTIMTNKVAMEKGIASKVTIKALILKYKEEERQALSKTLYSSEIDWLIQNKQRNNFITNLALSRKNNSLILFQYVQKHGKLLYDMLLERKSGRPIYYVHGGTDEEDRETIRQIVEKDENAIINASVGVFSTGVSINNLHSILFASPTKSKVRVLQSIGRGMRLHETKSGLELFDIVDDLNYQGVSNYALEHFLYRKKLYDREGFIVKVYHVDMGG